MFIDMFIPIVSRFEDIVKSLPEWNRDTRVDAQSLLLSISQFPFLNCWPCTYSTSVDIYKRVEY